MSFIQVHQSLVSHRKTLRLARLLGENRYTVVGRLVALWRWRLDNALENGCLGSDVDAVMLAGVMGLVSGWGGTPRDVVVALVRAGFLDVASDAQGERRLHIHDWQEWAPQTTTDTEATQTTVTTVYVSDLRDGEEG